MRSVVLVLALLVPAVARAQSMVTVNLSPEGQQLAQQLGYSAADLAAEIRSRIDDAYAIANVDDFLKAFADATSFSARGLGVDYASIPRGVIAGVAANVAAAGEDNVRSEELPTAGLAANIAVLLGMNLAEWNHPRWTVFANGFYRTASAERLDGTITSIGAHLQYTVIPPAPNDVTGAILRWTGVNVTGGLEYTRWSLGSGNEELRTDFGVANGGAVVVLDSVGRFDLSANAVTVPVEVATGMRVAMIATVYVGAGLDFTVGGSDIDASLAGTMTTTDGRNVGTASILASGDEGATPVTARVLAGVQLNLWKLKLFAQLNASQTPAASVGFGLKFVQ